MKLKDVFDLNQGHQITDEELYLFEGEVPVLTGQNEIKGHWNKSIIDKEDLPCITYPTKGNSGQVYVQYKIFDANNTAVLVPFKSWRPKVNLKWIAYKLRTMFLKIQTSKAGVSYLNKEIVEELELDIPPVHIQEAQIKKITEVIILKSKLNTIKRKIKRLNENPIIIEYEKYQGIQVPVSEIFDSLSGNSGLTEEFIYSKIKSKKEKQRYKVLSSSTIDRTQMGEIPMCILPSGRKLKAFDNKEGLLVIRNGNAGDIFYLETGNYTLNDHAYILFQKKNSEYDVNMKWVAFTQNSLFKEYASQSSNGTWTKTGFFKHAKMDVPCLEEQQEIVQKFEEINSYESKINKIYEQIEKVLSREPAI